MKITKGYLQQVIKEETQKVILEGGITPQAAAKQTSFVEGTHIKCPECQSVFALSRNVETKEAVTAIPTQGSVGDQEDMQTYLYGVYK